MTSAVSRIKTLPSMKKIKPTLARIIGKTFLCFLKYDDTSEAIANKTLRTKIPISKLSSSKKAKLAKGNKMKMKGVTKQCIAHKVEVQIPKLSRFNLNNDFIVFFISQTVNATDLQT
ncbi:MAG: hypothetical protein ACI97P_002217 [Arcticibacterium sp.]|jgi:hypothetical protein